VAGRILRQGFSSSGKVQLHQVGGDPVLGSINLAVAELLADGTWSRIRICDDEHCRHAFYDTTRSRTQRRHSYEICGNRSNVAAYRNRNRKRAESAS
jgi:predicted RNA-binding Zn ribbon-like protein